MPTLDEFIHPKLNVYSFPDVKTLEQIKDLWPIATDPVNAPALAALFDRGENVKSRKQRTELVEMWANVLEEADEAQRRTLLKRTARKLADWNFLDTHLDHYLEVRAGRGDFEAKQFAKCLKKASDPKVVADKFFAMDARARGTVPFSGKSEKLAVKLLDFYVSEGVTPPNKAHFSPFSDEITSAMQAISPLPTVSLKPASKTLFKDPSGDGSKEFALDYKARFLIRWFAGIKEELKLTTRDFPGPMSIRVAGGDDMLIKNKGYVTVGWMEPFQYYVAFRHAKSADLAFIDHETLAVTSVGLQAFLDGLGESG